MKLSAVLIDKIEGALERFNRTRLTYPIACQPEVNDAWNDVLIALNEAGFDTSKGMMRAKSNLKGGV